MLEGLEDNSAALVVGCESIVVSKDVSRGSGASLLGRLFFLSGPMKGRWERHYE